MKENFTKGSFIEEWAGAGEPAGGWSFLGPAIEELLALLGLKGKAGAGEAWGMERAMARGTLVEGCGHIRIQREAGEEEEEEMPKRSPPYLSSPAESPLGTAPWGARKQGTSVM